MNPTNQYSKTVFTTAVIVAALGYFVDIYDLLLFSIVRKASLESIGYSGADLEKYGLDAYQYPNGRNADWWNTLGHVGR
jgi:hypothetical protein